MIQCQEKILLMWKMNSSLYISTDAFGLCYSARMQIESVLLLHQLEEGPHWSHKRYNRGFWLGVGLSGVLPVNAFFFFYSTWHILFFFFLCWTEVAVLACGVIYSDEAVSSGLCCFLRWGFWWNNTRLIAFPFHFQNVIWTQFILFACGPS